MKLFSANGITSVFSLLQRGKVLEDYKVLGKYLVIACDGTGMFSSNTVHCESCCEKHHKDGQSLFEWLKGISLGEYSPAFRGRCW